MADRFDGDLRAWRRDDGTVRLELVNPGPLRISRELLDQAEAEWLSRAEDVITFHSLEDDGSRRAYRYRIVGGRGEWVLTEPVDDHAEPKVIP